MIAHLAGNPREVPQPEEPKPAQPPPGVPPSNPPEVHPPPENPAQPDQPAEAPPAEPPVREIPGRGSMLATNVLALPNPPRRLASAGWWFVAARQPSSVQPCAPTSGTNRTGASSMLS